MYRYCFALIFSFLAFGSSAANAQEDRWDSMMEMATQSVRAGDLKGARTLALKAAEQAKYEDPDRRVTSLALLATIAQELGDLSGAEEALREATDILDRVPGPLQGDKAILHNNLGTLLDQAGDLEGAEQQYRVALALQHGRQEARPEDRFSLLLNLAGLLERRGDLDGANQSYRDAGSLLPRLPTIASVTLNNNLGSFLHRRGRFLAAREHFDRAISSLPADASLPLLRASVLHNLGTAEFEAGNLTSAGSHLSEAEGIRRGRLGMRHTDTARTLSSLALLSERQGAPQTALALAREASTIIGASLVGSVGTRASAASAQTRRDWRDSFGAHLRLLSKAEPDTERKAREALEILQTVKHGELARVFAGAAFSGSKELNTSVRNIQSQSELLLAKERELVQELQSSSPSATRERALRTALATAHEALETLQAGLARDFPAYHELVAGRIAPLGSVQAALGAEEAVLIYFVGEAESFGVAITRESARLIHSPRGRGELAKAVRDIRLSVDPEHANESRFAFDQAHAVYRDLVLPAESLISRKAIWFVIPDGPLESLPLSLLLTSEVPKPHRQKWGDAPWLVRQHALVTLPSLGALILARNRPSAVSAPEPFIAFADPAIGVGNVAPSTPHGARTVRTTKIGSLWIADGPRREVRERSDFSARGEKPISMGKRLADPNLIRRLESLPDTEEEARAVAATLGGGMLMLRNDATETKLKALDLSRYRNLLFATHGAMADDFLEFGEPALVMTPPAVATEQDDGLLAASEIAQLKLNADWVVLSACNTAAADGTPGAEGLSGLAKAFFHAGARNLLVSHWSVVSESTVRLSTGTFSRLGQRPEEGKARALQHSILSLLDSGGRFQHPMFWAPFVLVGDGR